MHSNLLCKPVKSYDLALLAGKKRFSPRTRFVHLFPNDEHSDTIPLYENFCFALALFRQKTAESVSLGKDLIDRLLAFQGEDGNFPIFLHEYPKCHDFYQSLKIAPILIYLLRLFPNILGSLTPKIESALAKALSKKPEKPQFENRYRACMGLELLPVDTFDFSADDWTDHLITLQLAGVREVQIPFDAKLGVLRVPLSKLVQEGREPRSNPAEWLFAEGNYTKRHLKDHPHQLLCAPLFPMSYQETKVKSPFPYFWSGQTLHSLEPSQKNLQACSASALIYQFSENMEIGRGDLFEACMYCDFSEETEIFINGQKGTTFWLGDLVEIRVPEKIIELKFDLVEGVGDFCGHIFRANRPSQVCKGHEAYDWQIGLRTLRRSPSAQIRIGIRDC